MKTDAVAVGLSGLCLAHCLALPLLAAMLPVLGLLAEAEWVHQALVVLAVPIALFAFAQAANGQIRALFGLVAGLGASLLVAGAFVEALHDYETLLTVLGAILLAGAHLYRWQSHAA